MLQTIGLEVGGDGALFPFIPMLVGIQPLPTLTVQNTNLPRHNMAVARVEAALWSRTTATINKEGIDLNVSRVVDADAQIQLEQIGAVLHVLAGRAYD